MSEVAKEALRATNAESNETTRAMGVEFTLLLGQNSLLQVQNSNWNSETTRATGVEFALQQTITNETVRALEVESSIQVAVNSALSGLTLAMAAISTLTSSLSTMSVNFDQSQIALMETNKSLAEAKASIYTLTQIMASHDNGGSEGACSNISTIGAASCEPG